MARGNRRQLCSGNQSNSFLVASFSSFLVLHLFLGFPLMASFESVLCPPAGCSVIVSRCCHLLSPCISAPVSSSLCVPLFTLAHFPLVTSLSSYLFNFMALIFHFFGSVFVFLFRCEDPDSVLRCFFLILLRFLSLWFIMGRQRIHRQTDIAVLLLPPTCGSVDWWLTQASLGTGMTDPRSLLPSILHDHDGPTHLSCFFFTLVIMLLSSAVFFLFSA